MFRLGLQKIVFTQPRPTTDKAIVQVNLSLMPDEGTVNKQEGHKLRRLTPPRSGARRRLKRSAFGGALVLELREKVLDRLGGEILQKRLRNVGVVRVKLRPL